MAPLIAMVAGEASGDLLGAALIEAVRERLPAVRFTGLAGARMRAAGCEPLGSSDELAVMGLVEPLRHLPRLLALRRRLQRTFVAQGASLFIGVDSPAFNIGLAHRLRATGIATVQYASPQVWAWRRGRVRAIARAVDAVLCLLPFEPAAYAGQPVQAHFVGHPLADTVPLEPQREAARSALGLGTDATVVAVLPGSRDGEVRRLGADFARATLELRRLRDEQLRFIAPMASPHVAGLFGEQLRAAGADIRLLQGQADEALAASDLALVASGTATLQALLHRVPMVVAYRLAPLTAFIARDLKLVKLRHFSLPNLLAGEELVPELFQEAATPAALGAQLHRLLGDDAGRRHLACRFGELHRQLRQDAAGRAAQVVIDLLHARGQPG